MTLSDVVRVWINGRALGTQQKYKLLAAHLEADCQRLFNKSLLEAKTPELVGLFRGISGEGRTRATKTYVMKGFYKVVRELGLRVDNPMDSIRAPKFEDKIADRIITHEQVQAIIAAGNSERDRVYMRLLYNAGLRRAEALALKKSDVLGNGAIRVWGKGQKTAYVRIAEGLERILLKYVETLPPDGWLFPSPVYHGSALTPEGGWIIVKTAAKRAGFPKVSPHWFRHAFATEALARGASLAVLKQSLRHVSIDTTMKYLHIAPTEGAALYLPPID